MDSTKLGTDPYSTPTRSLGQQIADRPQQQIDIDRFFEQRTHVSHERSRASVGLIGDHEDRHARIEPCQGAERFPGMFERQIKIQNQQAGEPRIEKFGSFPAVRGRDDFVPGLRERFVQRFADDGGIGHYKEIRFHFGFRPER